MPGKLPFLRTPRLATRPLVAFDASRLVEFAGRADVARHMMSVKPAWTVREAEAWIAQSAFADRPGFRLAVVGSDEGLVGFVGLSPVRANGAPDTMYAIDPDHWGQGLATEVMGAFLDACFAQFDLPVIDADHFDDNPASGRVLRKLGFRRIGADMGRSAARLEPAPVSLYRLKRADLKARP